MYIHSTVAVFLVCEASKPISINVFNFSLCFLVKVDAVKVRLACGFHFFCLHTHQSTPFTCYIEFLQSSQDQ